MMNPVTKNGNVIPVTGIKPITTPILIITWIAIIEIIPTARKLPYKSGAFKAIRIPRHNNKANNKITKSHQ